MKALILAAGVGKRLSGLNKNIPKCLLQIGNKTILERQIEILNSCGINDITIVVGAKGDCWTDENQEKIKKIINNIKINPDNLNKEQAFSLSIGLKDTKEGPILIIDGDLFFTEDVLLEVINNKYETVLLSRIAKDKADVRNQILTKNKKVIGMGTNIAQDSDFPWYINAGLVKIGKNLFNSFKKETSKIKYQKGFLYHVVDSLCKEHDIYPITSKYSWININTYKDLLQAKKLIA